MTKDVIPWKCQICSGEFDIPHGGICSRCNRATCRDHLRQIGTNKLESKWVCSNCLSNKEKVILNEGTEKISKGTMIFARVSAWLLIMLALYLKWSDLSSEQFYLYFLYPFFAAYVVAGAWYQAWYLVTFKNTVGRPKFFLTIFLQISFVVLVMMAADYGYERGKLLFLIGLLSFIHVVIVVALYRKAKNDMATA